MQKVCVVECNEIKIFQKNRACAMCTQRRREYDMPNCVRATSFLRRFHVVKSHKSCLISANSNITRCAALTWMRSDVVNDGSCIYVIRTSIRQNYVFAQGTCLLRGLNSANLAIKWKSPHTSYSNLKVNHQECSILHVFEGVWA